MARTTELGPPDITLAGLRIWIHTPPGDVPQDGPGWTWLRSSAHCADQGAGVWVAGEIFTLEDLRRWRDGCRQLAESLQGVAKLDCVEPELRVELRAVDRLGHLEMVVDITPDHLSQKHRFSIGVDQSYLNGLIGSLDDILASRRSGGLR